MILYRPVGTAELELIHKSGDKEFPSEIAGAADLLSGAERTIRL